jgi:hypothetical protein
MLNMKTNKEVEKTKIVKKKKVYRNDFTEHKDSQKALELMIKTKPITDGKLKEWVAINQSKEKDSI